MVHNATRRKEREIARTAALCAPGISGHVQHPFIVDSPMPESYSFHVKIYTSCNDDSLKVIIRGTYINVK